MREDFRPKREIRRRLENTVARCPDQDGIGGMHKWSLWREFRGGARREVLPYPGAGQRESTDPRQIAGRFEGLSFMKAVSMHHKGFERHR